MCKGPGPHGAHPDGKMAQRGDRAELRERDREAAAEDEYNEALKQETVIVFDWDDTILPTSWLERTNALTGGGELRPKAQQEVAALSTIATQTLNLAETMGQVLIITNSAPGWVDQSCALFMPQLAQKMRGYQIFAKPMHAPITFKIGAFQRECRQFRNLVSVGDGEAERAASLRLQAPDRGRSGVGSLIGEPLAGAPRRIKSVKLLELPTCQHLIAQHEMLQGRLADVTAFQGHLDLKSRFPAMGGMGSPLANAKGGGCALVHFGSLRSLPTGLRASKSSSQLPSLGRATSPIDEFNVGKSTRREDKFNSSSAGSWSSDRGPDGANSATGSGAQASSTEQERDAGEQAPKGAMPPHSHETSDRDRDRFEENSIGGARNDRRERRAVRPAADLSPLRKTTSGAGGFGRSRADASDARSAGHSRQGRQVHSSSGKKPVLGGLPTNGTALYREQSAPAAAMRNF